VSGYFCGAVDPADIPAEIDRTVPLLGAAGSMSFHHVRLLHGSAQNVSDRPRALLLYGYAAADAWPLLGVKDLADFERRLVTGEPSVEARVSPAPVRMPLPPAIHQGSIYENQSDASRRYFAVAPEAVEAART
jgi:phytanoyl-CoA hydroxylase